MMGHGWRTGGDRAVFPSPRQAGDRASRARRDRPPPSHLVPDQRRVFTGWIIGPRQTRRAPDAIQTGVMVVLYCPAWSSAICAAHWRRVRRFWRGVGGASALYWSRSARLVPERVWRSSALVDGAGLNMPAVAFLTTPTDLPLSSWVWSSVNSACGLPCGLCAAQI